MPLEQAHEKYWNMTPGPFDVHAHPRVFDAVTEDGFVAANNGTEGKAGIRLYSEGALRSGITGLIAMPNESRRVYDVSVPEQTVVEPYPIATRDKVDAMISIIGQESVIPAGVYMGLDPETIYWDLAKSRIKRPLLEHEFTKVRDECLGLKIYLAETTGGYAINAQHGPEVANTWHQFNPDKPIVFHVEGKGVARLLRSIGKLEHGKEMPIHIAHVSSRDELQAVIVAKERGMNVTCEVTPHHLFMTKELGRSIGGYGCMKPGLKSSKSIQFLWDNLKYIDIFASDCAPHRVSDKETDKPAFGVTNHSIMLPLLFGAAQTGRLSVDDIYQKFCIAPRQRFNLPIADGSKVGYSTQLTQTPQRYERAVNYGQNPFTRLKNPPRMVGEVVVATAGVSLYDAAHELKLARASLKHALRPKNLHITE
jgi:hypothetical protein